MVIVEALFEKDTILAPSSDFSRELYDKGRYGEPKRQKFQYSFVESLYLLERKKISIISGRTELDFDKFLKKAKKKEPNFWVRYNVYKDMRNRGYIVKTALKFGADFRIYDRGVKPGEDHAKWILYAVHEAEAESWYNFSAKNRVAHSTKKRLLIGCVDDEGDVTYWEIKWTKP